MPKGYDSGLVALALDMDRVNERLEDVLGALEQVTEGVAKRRDELDWDVVFDYIDDLYTARARISDCLERLGQNPAMKLLVADFESEGPAPAWVEGAQ